MYVDVPSITSLTTIQAGTSSGAECGVAAAWRTAWIFCFWEGASSKEGPKWMRGRGEDMGNRGVEATRVCRRVVPP
jgi:hypothetical protein